MRVVLLICVALFQLNAAVYYAKLEPVEVYSIKANASGKVTFADRQNEGKIVKNGVIIQLDDELDRVELGSLQEKLVALKNMAQATKSNYESLQEIVVLKTDQYERVKELKTKSQLSKESDLIALLNASAQASSVKSNLHSLENQITDLGFSIANLKDKISNKKIVLKDLYLYALHVNEFDYVANGAMLAQVYDTRSGKLVLFVSMSDLQNIQNKKIYINDKPSELKIDKLWMVSDEHNISSYRVEILIPAPKIFSQLLKVEFKE